MINWFKKNRRNEPDLDALSCNYAKVESIRECLKPSVDRFFYKRIVDTPSIDSSAGAIEAWLSSHFDEDIRVQVDEHPNPILGEMLEPTVSDSPDSYLNIVEGEAGPVVILSELLFDNVNILSWTLAMDIAALDKAFAEESFPKLAEANYRVEFYMIALGLGLASLPLLADQKRGLDRKLAVDVSSIYWLILLDTIRSNDADKFCKQQEFSGIESDISKIVSIDGVLRESVVTNA
jgi:hypothetical protein